MSGQPAAPTPRLPGEGVAPHPGLPHPDAPALRTSSARAMRRDSPSLITVTVFDCSPMGNQRDARGVPART